ncbi:hypothetical protein [Streptomyces uncialis]|uniref:hypothetical protein n=1 Tax=Streptomyces uncialis TaxID=1048205 RepID=UPI0022533479|nr:hypothetical protein [Streptomyces uncialis]MCX4664610.1 hypothetical protein [Streptomyces uncialis]WTE11594.1 hypothetical protein OG924_15725 [Streptomyces uncialis]
MGSLRNPIGPLPSSIYWRRRGLLLIMAALLALLVVWIVSSRGGDGGGGDDADGSNSKNPVESITPGPSGSGPAISEKPGGRDESEGSTEGSGGSGSAGSGTGGGSGGTEGTGGTGSPSATGTGDPADSGDTGGTGGTGGNGGSANGGTATGGRLPAGSNLPNCAPASVRLTLRSVQNTYEPGQTPKLELVAQNSSASDCKLDLGPERAVVTITQSGSDKDIWASDHCPDRSANVLVRVPADGRTTHTFPWDREQSAPKCATPPAGDVSPGTYLVEAKTPGLPTARTSFVLTRD